MDFPATMIWRLCIAWVCALLVAAAALSAVPSASYYIEMPQKQTQRHLASIGTELREYKQHTGSLPASLEALQTFDKDSWGRPLAYSVRGGRASVVSYGADGVAGGAGIDSDLSLDNPKPPGSGLTRRQMYAHPSSRPMEIVALLSGACVFAWVFTSAKLEPQNLNRSTLLSLGFKAALMTFFAAIFALIITGLHVPSGH